MSVWDGGALVAQPMCSAPRRQAVYQALYVVYVLYEIVCAGAVAWGGYMSALISAARLMGVHNIEPSHLPVNLQDLPACTPSCIV